MSFRVLMTSDAVGGVWNYSVSLAEALAPHGIEIHLATMGPAPSPEQRQAAERLSNLTLHVSTYRLEWMDQPWKDLEWSGEWLMQLEEQLKPDLIHLNTYAHGTLPWRAPVMAVGHSCVYSWWRHVKGTEPPRFWNRYREAVAAGLAGADLIAAPTRAMLDELACTYGPFAAPTRVIPNGVDGARFAPAEGKQDLIFAAGRVWDEGKNVQSICMAAPGLSWPVRVAGEATSPDGRAIDCPDVELLGKVPADEMPSHYAQAAIFAHPARYEPFGLAPVEAALSGCALVLGDIDTLREIWRGAALFVPPDDVAELRRTLQDLSANEPLRLRLAETARARALELTPEAMARGVLEAYASLTEHRAAEIPAPAGERIAS
ncbi:MAG: glycosyltransferase family 4 protein [Sumerlaeia bacterium]